MEPAWDEKELSDEEVKMYVKSALEPIYHPVSVGSEDRMLVEYSLWH